MDKFKKYKLVADFNVWSKTNDPDKIYCICTEDGEELFDVYEDDFLSMVDNGIVNCDGYYHLLNNPTQEQIAEYAKQYGIHWTDLERTKSDVANEYVQKAINALVDAVTTNLRNIKHKEVLINILSSEYGEDKEETWKATISSNEIVFTNDGNKEYNIDDLTISTLIDIHNAILCGNINT